MAKIVLKNPYFEEEIKVKESCERIADMLNWMETGNLNFLTLQQIEPSENIITINPKHFAKVEFYQSTGLKDKNGQEIFEGDIVRQVRTQPTTENEIIIGVVTMLEGAWLIMNDCEQLASFLWSETDENEIIGNIYENPELLEVGD